MPMSKNPSALDVMTYRQRFSVSFSYPVHFCEQLFNIANPLFVETLSLVNADRRHRFVVVADKGVLAHWHRLSDDVEAYAAHYKSNLEMAAPLLAVRGGEETKNNLNHLQRVVSYLQKHRIDRHAYVVVVGGGAVLDMVGLAASIVHRGIRLVRVPTTVLAQNDAGIGVKNGINAFGTKNFLGSFDPPFAVLNDYRFLETLPKKDRIAGIAEAVKVALIRDPTFFAWLENNVHLLRTYDEKASA